MHELDEFLEFWNDEDVNDEDYNAFTNPEEVQLDVSILEAYRDSLNPESDYA